MFEIKKDGLFLNGKEFKIYSGTMHYFRVLPQYWDDRFAKLKACGFNAVETVMCWNLHEPQEGKFDFSGMLDIAAYCKAAQKYGLYVIMRPGPYTCAEWDNGGFPAWLIADDNIRLRCNHPTYMQKVKNYFKQVFKILNSLEVTNGGNILAYQIENEYGSYGNDKEYLNALKDIMIECGAKVPFFTSDGNTNFMLSGGTLPDVYKTLNFGSHASTAFNCLKNIQPDMPKTCMEFWCGWFDHWGGIHHKRNANSVAKEIQNMVDNNLNINIYTFHGGTNFNFWAGSNYYTYLRPDVTSYDDAALLNEYGDYTKAFHLVREILHKAQGLPLGQLPPRPQLQNIGAVELTQKVDLWKAIKSMGKIYHVAHPEYMEKFGQNFGLILYTTTIRGSYPCQKLRIDGVHDIAYLKVNGKLVKTYHRPKNKKGMSNDGFSIMLPAFEGECKIEILVEAMGRINYGIYMKDQKGIARVILGMQQLFGWEVRTLPMDDFSKITFENSSQDNKKQPSILKGTFAAQQGKDCFVDMRGFKKGFVIVNGFNIGRYWKVGPQRTLYLPAPLLKNTNEIIIVEQEGYLKNQVKIIDKHLL